MLTQNYNPAFWSQEFVEKLLQENFPFVKVNDITAFTCANFEDVTVHNGFEVPDIVLYYGFITSNEREPLLIHVLRLDSSLDLISLDCFPMAFPLLTLGCNDNLTPAVFTGWKITCSAAVAPADDEVLLNYSISDLLISISQGASVYTEDGDPHLRVAASFGNAETPELSFNGGAADGMYLYSPGLYSYDAEDVIAAIQIENNAVVQFNDVYSALQHYYSYMHYTPGATGLGSLTTLRSGSLSISVGHVPGGTGTVSFDEYVRNAYGAQYDNSVVVAAGNLSMVYSLALLPYSVLSVEFTDVYFGITDTVHFKIPHTWVIEDTHFLSTEYVADNAYTTKQRKQIQGTPGATVTITVTMFNNPGSNVIRVNDEVVTGLADTFDFVIGATGYTEPIDFFINVLSDPLDLTVITYEITAVTDGEIGTPDTYTISRIA